ncbi:hypothetical protein AMAG_19955 [Allomyces macrogynus ATCC 38327]|uniref:Uncharacterized protein n=1 Tax=Allomyces macrogynus (strain ATCC 38327) TaxID=578462 RepID=A0A0L0T300_ALLM3|nr:hypothetical protein AMAG_19955 [Allomyces macrogynus ATCC 38327]|eukprot:KNE69087.1 hypothetical protein AMAG_19955 [Allomyces macrogynus ATCC 38327]
MSTRCFTNWIEPTLLARTDPLIWQGNLDETLHFILVCLVSPIIFRLGLKRRTRSDDGPRAVIQRTTTAIFFFVLSGLASWVLLAWGYQIAYLLMPLGIPAGLTVMVCLVRRVECIKTVHLWRSHFDFVPVHFAGHVVFRGLAAAATRVTRDSWALSSSLASFAVEFGVPGACRAIMSLVVFVMAMTASMAFRRHDPWMSCYFHLAEELAILWLSLRTRASLATLALMALTTVALIVFIDSGFLSDVVFAWRAHVPLRDLHGDTLKQLLARQLPPHSSCQRPRVSRRTHIFRSGNSFKPAASRFSNATISAPTPAISTPSATRALGTSGQWTPRLIIKAHRRLRKHAGIAPQYHLAEFIAVLCTVVFRVVSLQAGAPDDRVA